MKWLWPAAALCAVAAAAPGLTTTTSASRQFIAHAPDPLVSSALCALAERLKTDWLRQLDLPDKWRDPVVLIVRERGADDADLPAIRSEALQIGDRLQYQITCHVPPPVEDETLAAHIVEALCAEFANRDQPRPRDAPMARAPVPLWLAEGFAQTILTDSERHLASIRHRLAGGNASSAMELMRVMELPADDVARESYRAQARLWTESLLRMPDGTRKMRRLLLALGATKHFGQSFAAVYGDDLPDELFLEKWWSLEQVRRAEMTIAEFWSATDTAERLDALMARLEGAPPRVLLEKLAGLETLRRRGHPLYRPVVVEYSRAVGFLLQKKPKACRRILKQADRQRAEVEELLRQIRETLDRVESTELAK